MANPKLEFDPESRKELVRVCEPHSNIIKTYFRKKILQKLVTDRRLRVEKIVEAHVGERSQR